jgi:hypothetical protein
MLQERKSLGKQLTYRNNKLVTACADDYLISCFKEHDCEVTVLSKFHEAEFDITDKDSIRKILDESDVLVFLPGNLRSKTLLLTLINYASEEKLDIPIILLNSNHFFDMFISMVNNSIDINHTIASTTSDSVWNNLSVSSRGIYEAQNIDEVLYIIEKISEYAPLADMVSIGDYVNYPVAYENITLENGQKSNLTGWRVLNKYLDCVYLISAGTPLAFTFNKEDDTPSGHDKIRAALKWNISNANFTLNGISPSEPFTKIFINSYTLDVNIAVAEDFEAAMGGPIYLGLPKGPRQSLLINGTDLYLLSFHDQLCHLDQFGKFSNHTYGTYGVRPIVILKPNILTKGKDANSIWQLG